MKRVIKKVAVLGSGVMGSQIACHFANVGMEVLMLDILPKEAPQGNSKVRNAVADGALKQALKMKPSPIYSKSFAKRIQTGNFTDNMKDIADCDWIIEVIIERLDIKKSIFEEVERYRRPGSLVTSNTSGIPIHLMAEGRSEDFKQHFSGSHFFNPPRYLKLLEITPTQDTLPEVTEFLLNFGSQFLGKTTVLAKDTPAFIGNRIGVFALTNIFRYIQQADLSVEFVDQLTGSLIGHPKSATFRTADVVGIDTLALVMDDLANATQATETKENFKTADFIHRLVAKKWLGSKTKQGFYKKMKDENGKSQIWALDLKKMDYRPSEKIHSEVYTQAKNIQPLEKRLQFLFADQGEIGDFYRATHYPLFEYITLKIPEITEDLFRIDDGMEAGFGWQLGPFKIWDALGVQATVEYMTQQGYQVADWVSQMLEKGYTSFYKVENGQELYYDIQTATYQIIPGTEDLIRLENLRKDHEIWHNAECSLIDLGDGIINVEFHSKMNTIGGGVLEGINHAIDLAEEKYRGVVISNEGEHFSAGANVGLIFMMAVDQEYDELDFAIKQFQNTSMRIRHCSVPVVIAPHGLTLGGGCEFSMHSDMVVAHAEMYMGLVELGVGLIPGGGGTKEFAIRLSDSIEKGDVELNLFTERFLTIGQAKVSTSAQEAFELGYLRPGIDKIVISRKHQLTEAKAECLRLAEEGYTAPLPRKDIRVLGNSSLGLAYVGADSMRAGNYISKYDQFIAQKLAYVLSGGDLSEPSKVSEQYLLNLERQAFLELCTQRKTLERLQAIVKGEQPLRN